MKTISIVIPTFNEEQNIPLIYNRISKLFKEELSSYDYRILFVDNCSKDNSRIVIKKLAHSDNKVQFIFYVRNFGFSKSTFYGLTQAQGDCAVLLFADMQDPPELIKDFIEKWEKGNKVVVGIKSQSDENAIVYQIRTAYYRIMKKISSVDHIEHFTGFGLYDRSVIDILRSLSDPLPYLRGVIAELSPDCEKVYYRQEQRKYGKSSFHFLNLYDVAMLGITSYSKIFMRIATFFGVSISIISLVIAVVTFILKLTGIVNYPVGTAAMIFGIYFIGGAILFFMGILGEYMQNINIRSMNHPIVVEEERGNFE